MPKRFPLHSSVVRRRAEVGLKSENESLSLQHWAMWRRQDPMRCPNYLDSPWQPLIFISLPAQSEAKQEFYVVVKTGTHSTFFSS